MNTTRLRQTFRYPDDSDADANHAREELDEEGLSLLVGLSSFLHQCSQYGRAGASHKTATDAK